METAQRASRQPVTDPSASPPSRPRSLRRALPTLPWFFAVALLAACGTPALPPLTLDSVETEADSPYAIVVGSHLRGDAEVRVCGVAASLVVVTDAFGQTVTSSSRTGVQARFRVPDLGADELTCDLTVLQPASRGRQEVATLTAGLAYVPYRPLAGTRVLLYASIFDGNGAASPRARFFAAVAATDVDERLDLTVIDGTETEYEAGVVATRFAERLASDTWDVVVFLEEQFTLPTAALEATADFVRGGGRALASYWLTYHPDDAFGGPARALAAALDALVTPDDNVVPVLGGSVDIALRSPLSTGIGSAYRLVNDGFYVESYAQRLTPDNGAVSVCDYLDDEGGSCAVGGQAGETLFLGFTLAPLSVSMSGDELETLLRNTLRYVVLGPEASLRRLQAED